MLRLGLNFVVNQLKTELKIADEACIFCLSYKTRRYAQRAQTSADAEDPDFRLWTQNPFTSLRVIRRTDRQTDRQTDKQTELKT